MLIKSKYLQKLNIIYIPCFKVKVIKSKFIKVALMLLRNFDFANP
jgi:hypothetical protein